MTVQTAGETRTFSQISRQPQIRQFQQGFSGTSITNSFAQSSAKGVVDILIVMDNSGSMSQEQTNMATKLAPLLSYISDADWKIGVVTTDANNGCMRGVISKGEANAETIFAKAINAGIRGSGNERGFLTARMGIQCSTPSWIRPGSSLAVLFVSDEDARGNSAEKNPQVLRDAIIATGRTIGDDAKFYALVKPNGSSCNYAYSAPLYNAIVTDSAGVIGNICESDYKAPLMAISQNVANILDAQVSLSNIPDKATVSIKVNSQPWAGGFSIQDKVLTFASNALPPSGASISVSYDTPSTPIEKTFALGETPAQGTLSAKINGVVQNPNSYSISGKSITFASNPAENAQIQIDFLRDSPLQKIFSIDPKVISKEVKVNGNTTTAYSFDAATGNITFNNAPTDDATISLELVREVGHNLQYIGPYPSGQLNITCFKENGATMPCSYANKSITITEAEFEEGKSIRVRYISAGANTASWEFDVNPAGLVESDAPDGLCELNLVESRLGVTCLNSTDATVNVSYDVFTKENQIFLMPLVLTPERATWKILLDGEEIQTFTRDGNMITVLAVSFEGKDSYEITIEAVYEEANPEELAE